MLDDHNYKCYEVWIEIDSSTQLTYVAQLFFFKLFFTIHGLGPVKILMVLRFFCCIWMCVVVSEHAHIMLIDSNPVSSNQLLD